MKIYSFVQVNLAIHSIIMKVYSVQVELPIHSTIMTVYSFVQVKLAISSTTTKIVHRQLKVFSAKVYICLHSQAC